MNDYLIICRSITHAQRISRLLQQKGIWNQIVRIPAGLVKSGCGYAVKVKERALQTALHALSQAQVPYVALFVQNGAEYREVRHDLL